MDILQEARESLENLRVADANRYDFVERVLEQMRKTLTEKADIEEKLKESEYTRANYRRDFESSQHELTLLRNSVGRNSFVLVLVDGDAAPFRDEFVQQKMAGGESAARELRRTVAEYIKEKKIISSDFAITIRVYSKMQYMNVHYHSVRILEEGITLQQFVQGFNRVDPLCDYIDAGNDKEGADSKVQDTMKLFVDNVHCKHIILCASQDNSYTGFLRRFVHNGKVSDNITLVESIPFPDELAKLSPSFLVTKFSKIFRETKIPTRRLSKIGETGQDCAVPAVSYASTASKQVEGASRTTKPFVLGSVRSKSMQSCIEAKEAFQEIRVNAANQRVDPKLPHYNRDLVPGLKSRKLCNRHFLTLCNYDNCQYAHKASLDSSELAALRFIARLGACENGTNCRDAYCVASHMCTYGAKCTQPDDCRYPPSMHHLDPEPVRSVPARSSVV